ncbi:unnamed protein product, partial [Iphiclides podalirius]
MLVSWFPKVVAGSAPGRAGLTHPLSVANIRLSDAELNLAEEKVKSAKTENLALRGHYTTSKALEPITYASALKIAGRAGPTPITQGGPVVAFYPVDEQADKLKTAEDTKAELKNKVRPEVIEIQVERMRKVGNAGVVVQTTSIEAAEKLMCAAPPTLRTAVPKARPPQVALRNLDGDPEPNEIIAAIYEQNFKGTSWSPEKLAKDLTDIVVRTAHECLGVRKPRRDAGYERWNSKLETARKRTLKLRTVWQKSKRIGGSKEIIAGDSYRAASREYRNLMGVEQSNHFRQAYRVASGRIHPPANIINATKYIEGHVGTVEEVATAALCPDDNPSRDSAYHRGQEVEMRRSRIEDMIGAHGLLVWIEAGQPSTFAGPNGSSNIDVTITTRSGKVQEWCVHPEASSSDHRLITFLVGDSRPEQGNEVTSSTLIRFRERGVCWAGFRAGISLRMGSLNVHRPPSQLAEDFTNAIVRTTHDSLGVRKSRKDSGYEWWNVKLEMTR